MEETSFPRGGGGRSNRLDAASAALSDGAAAAAAASDKSARPAKRKKPAATGAGDDFLFGTRPAARRDASSSHRGTKKKKRRNDVGGGEGGASSSMLPLGGGSVLQPTTDTTLGGNVKPALIESLSFQKLGKGTRLFGIVRDVTPDYAVVSLPNMLTGFVRRRDGERALTSVLTEGTAMAVSVVKTTTETVASEGGGGGQQTKRRIELSVSPSVVNSDLTVGDLHGGRIVRGRVVSCEDHGCLVDLGVGGAGRAFLRYENVEGGYVVRDDGDDDEGGDGDGGEDEDIDEEMGDAGGAEGGDGEDDDGGGDDDDEEEDSAGGSDDADDRSGDGKFVLNPGRVYDFTVKSVPPTAGAGAGKKSTAAAASPSIVQLELSRPSTLSKIVTSVDSTSARGSGGRGQTLRTLQAGMLLRCYVEHHARNGLCVTFLGNVFRGSIDMGHLGGYWSGRDKLDGVKDPNFWWKDVFSGKLRTINARLIAVDPATKIVRLSLLPHILELRPPPVPTADDSVHDRSLPPVGTVVESAKVIRLDTGVGALLALPGQEDDNAMDEDGEEDEGGSGSLGGVTNLRSSGAYRSVSSVRCAYVHISKAMDAPADDAKGAGSRQRRHRTPESLFARHFALHATVPRLRILSTSNLVDNVASCATAESIVSSVALSYGDIVPGAVYRAVPIVKNMEGGGILVELGMGVRGLVPATHLFDKAQPAGAASSYRNKVRMEKFRSGGRVDVRCLQVDGAARRCVLTAKRALLQADLDDPITDYASIESGRIATGFISRVDRTGVTVTFYNNVYGKASARRLAEELGVEDPTTNYHVGDVVRARVVSCRKKAWTRQDGGTDERHVLDLSLNTSTNEGANDRDPSASAGQNVKLEPGSVLLSKCMKIVHLVDSHPNHRDGGASYVPGYAVVTIKSKYLATSSEDDNKENQTVDCKIPFDQILDSYESDVSASADGLNKLARRVLKVGKKINQPAVVIAGGGDGRGMMPIVSLRPAIVKTATEAAAVADSDVNPKVSLPTPGTSLFMGAIIQGYCARVDPRYGAFVRFLDGLTGLVPKLKGGLDVQLYETVFCKIVALDVTSGSKPKILLKRLKSVEDSCRQKKKKGTEGGTREIVIKPGDVVGDVKVENVNFARATVALLNENYSGGKVRSRIHFTMADHGDNAQMPLLHPIDDAKPDAGKLTTYHPFHNWAIGDILHDIKCIAVDKRDGILYAELTNRFLEASSKQSDKGGKGDMLPPIFVEDPSQLLPGTAVSTVITRVCTQNRGIWIHICPGITGFIPGLELNDNVQVLNNLSKYYKVGSLINCSIFEMKRKNKNKEGKETNGNKKKDHMVYASVLLYQKAQASKKKGKSEKKSASALPDKPLRGELAVGRINRSLKPQNAPALMLELRGGYLGRCDITELDEMDEWVNMPLGRLEPVMAQHSTTKHKDAQGAIVTDESNNEEDEDGEDGIVFSDDEEDVPSNASGDYPHGKYVKCRVLSGVKSCPVLEVSLRESRLDGDLEDDEQPGVKEMVHAYVVNTNRKGCFVRLSRFVEGRVILKELSDGFLPDPVAIFPPGRLVIGKVKEVRQLSNDSKKAGKRHVSKAVVDLDMRETTLLENQDKLEFEDIKVGDKYKGTVTRVESYGVFVRIENSELSGLAHLSECSDEYIKNLADLYDPGDLVKVLVVKIDAEQKRFGLSLKASHFKDDSDSDEESSSSDSSLGDGDDEGDEDMQDALVSDEDDSNSIESDDENYATKLASRLESKDKELTSNSESDDTSESSQDESDSDSTDEEEGGGEMQIMDTDVGFDWGTKGESKEKKNESSDDESGSDSSSDESDDDVEVDNTGKSSHKSRKKAAARRREEKEISIRESALADGTADEHPETAADFERLLASDPNCSEHWIKYMAYHLSLADIDSARNVANRAFDRIEFRQEDEKLNVWTALLTLEFKYGSPKSLQETIDRASQHNNPKQVYLRVCEMLEREVDVTSAASASDNGQAHDAAIARADEMFAKMCKKFRNKKTVWIAHLKYLLKGARHEEAHVLIKRALNSLPSYKHVETMSKFAQLEFEHGSAERARTIFDTLVEKHPKRMDLLFVYVDKEVKHGEIGAARNVFESVVNPTEERRKKIKFSDKQMKSLFKKWFRVEEKHGNEQSRQNVKSAAKAYVERTAASKM